MAQAPVSKPFAIAIAERSYYVYTLADPRTGEVFYVGKGQGRRAYQHAAEARRNSAGNKERLRIIREILAAGLLPSVVFLASYESEDEAIEHEAREIAARTGLTNMQAVGRATSQGARRSAKWRQIKAWLEGFTPYHVWVRRKNWSAFERQMCSDTFAELVRCFRDPNRTANVAQRRDDGTWELRWE